MLATVSDRRTQVGSGSTLSYYTADVVSAQDYYPFGMIMPGRSVNVSSYRYGFNGQEKSMEIDADGNNMTAEFWQYDARIGRRWNVDPVYKHSPYEAFAGNPIWFSDPNGADSTVYLFSYRAKNPGSSVDGPGDKNVKEILNNVKTIFESNGISNLKYKMISQDDFMNGKIKLDPTDTIVGVIGDTYLSEGGSYISPNGNTEPGTVNGEGFGFPRYSYVAAQGYADKSKSDPNITAAFGVAHEIWHQYLLKADKVFLGKNAPSSSHYEGVNNLNATGSTLGPYLEKNRITSQTLIQHAKEGSIGYIMNWQRIYVNGYFKASNAGVSMSGNDAGKEATWKHIFNSSGWLFRTQMSGLKNFRNSMVGNEPPK